MYVILFAICTYLDIIFPLDLNDGGFSRIFFSNVQSIQTIH